MKIKSLTVKSNEVLGDLTLDFTRSDGNVADTIIFAGENGCGKSTLLKLIFEFCSVSLKDIDTVEEKEITVIFTDAEVLILKSLDATYSKIFDNGIKNNEMTFSYDYSVKNNWQQIKLKFKDLSDVEKLTHGGLFNKTIAKSIIQSVFSDVEINFTPQKISNVTSKDVDSLAKTTNKSSNNLATEISQLLIDIQALDDADFTKWARGNIGEKIQESHFNSRISRFTNAFNYIFEGIEYKGVENINGSKKIIFSTSKGDVFIEQLSSGEKQIVFRGSFLLMNKESSKGSIVLIDEPEISLHPKWQKKITKFNEILFSEKSGKQTSQLFIATHSPFVLHNSNRYKDKVIILKKSADGVITSDTNLKYFGWTNEKRIQEAFDISLPTNKVVVFVEGITDEMYLNNAISTLEYDSLPIVFKWVGRVNSKGNAEFTGDKSLNHVKSFYQENIEILEQKVILLYDSDTNKPDECMNDFLYIRKMPFQKENTLYKKGIENLLTLSGDFPSQNFYKERKKRDDYGAESIIRELDKTKLCDWICSDLSAPQRKLYYSNFYQVFDIIKDTLVSQKEPK